MRGLVLAAALSVATPVAAETYTSPAKQTPMLELFTSQGCSSCPPADAWLSGFVDDKRLWREVIPLAFHVDYWNGLGWPDRFSKAAYTDRQRAYRSAGQVSSVYTPGFVLAGEEWKGWFRGRPPQLGPGAKTGVLTLDARPGMPVKIAFAAQGRAAGKSLNAHVAVLGFGIPSVVTRGENRGKTLHEDFIVLGSRTAPVQKGKDLAWTLDWPETVAADAKRYAVVAWVSEPGNPAPVQAVGGWMVPRTN